MRAPTITSPSVRHRRIAGAHPRGPAPFALVARRRPARVSFGGLEIDFDARRVRAAGKEVRLTPKEFELLRYLVAHAGKPVTHRDCCKPFGDPITATSPNTCASSSIRSARSRGESGAAQIHRHRALGRLPLRGAGFILRTVANRPDQRPDPEELLRRVQAEERRAGRSRLKVFLGYAPRVGKSLRMFDEGRRRKLRGEDVVVGAVQGNVTPEVQEIVSRLEVVASIREQHAGRLYEVIDLTTLSGATRACA